MEDPDEEHVEDLGEALDRLADRVVGRVEQSAHEVGEEAREGQARHLLRQRALVEESRERLHEVLAEPQLRRRRVGAKVGEAELEAGRDGVDEGVDVQEDVLRVLGDLAQDELEDVGAGGAVVRLERVDERRQVRHGLGHQVVLGERCRRARRRSQRRRPCGGLGREARSWHAPARGRRRHVLLLLDGRCRCRAAGPLQPARAGAWSRDAHADARLRAGVPVRRRGRGGWREPAGGRAQAAARRARAVCSRRDARRRRRGRRTRRRALEALLEHRAVLGRELPDGLPGRVGPDERVDGADGVQGGRAGRRVGLTDERGDARQGLRDRVDVHAVAGVQLAELLDALAADASVLVVEALLEDGREDLAERVD